MTPKISYFLHSHSVWGSVTVSQMFMCMSRCLCQTAICPMGAVWRDPIGQCVWIERGLMGRVMCRTALRHTNTNCQLKVDTLRHTKTIGLCWHSRKSPCTHQKHLFCSAIFNQWQSKELCCTFQIYISYTMHFYVYKRSSQSEPSIPERSVL